MLFFTSDTHFGHRGVLKHMANRRQLFGEPTTENIAAHDEELIIRWNELVGKGDDVWHLGDFSLSRSKAAEIAPRLNGRIHLVMGNHDEDAGLDKLDCWTSVQRVKYLRYEGLRFFLLHYACRTWRGSNKGTYHLYGHSHGALPGYGRSCDIGVDCWDLCPVEAMRVAGILNRAHHVDHHNPIEDPCVKELL